MNWSILAITETTIRDFTPSDDKEYDRLILSLTRDEKYVIVVDADTRTNLNLFPIRSAILTKRTKNANRNELQ